MTLPATNSAADGRASDPASGQRTAAAAPSVPDLVREALDNVATEVHRTMCQSGDDAADIARWLAEATTGGKLVRASFAVAGWLCAGGPLPRSSADPVIRLAAAIEVFHAAALAHDDVIDRSAVRRGRPATHAAAATEFTQRQWHGDSVHFGITSAILVGDLGVVVAAGEAARAIAAAQLPAARAAQLMRTWTDMGATVTAGQYLDTVAQAVDWGDDPLADEKRAREVILAKTASYSVIHPLILGAGLAGGGATLADNLRELGASIGEAFQLRDDVLGLIGDERTTGKPTGGDIREGKRTVLMALAYQHADDAGRQLLRDTLGDESADAHALARITALVRDTGALREVEQRIDALHTTALANLDRLPAAPAGRQALRDLISRLAGRIS